MISHGKKKNKIAVNYNWRAEGLHKVLYQCPNCKAEYKMSTGGIEIRCNHCGKIWVMSEYGELSAKQGVTEFSHIPDWYEWERSQVAEEVKNGTYGYDLTASVDSLPKCQGFHSGGKGGFQTQYGWVCTGRTA